MGVPGFYSWLTKRYPMIKHMIDKESLPQIDYLYLDMNGIIYKCVKDDSVLFKAQLQPKELEEIWIEVFNYINMIVELLKPTKMVVMALDGVAPRSKMNNQRARRFKSSRDYNKFLNRLHGFTGDNESPQNFKNNSISPGTCFMQELNRMLNFFILKKIQEDDYWKQVSIVFTGSDAPGEGEHKIMEFIRANKSSFLPEDIHCLYGADADLIMLGLTLPMKNILIIREEYIFAGQGAQVMASRKQKQINFQLIYLTILRECFDIEYKSLKTEMKMEYSVENIATDFVFLFFFIGNDFLPRMYAYNIREKQIEQLIYAFKTFLKSAEHYITGGAQFNLLELARLLNEVSKCEIHFLQSKTEEANRFIARKAEFETELELRFRERVAKEEQSLQIFKQLYNQGDGSARAAFYSQKFKINPSVKEQEFYQIISSYIQGLKFVYEYYFVNLPSWSWYYPYYYAPLISDISIYLNILVANKAQLPALVLDSPFNPFKQLLCILPKESHELLPLSFQKHLINLDSKLRSPFDFYPDHFEDDLYGSTRNHQAVSLIPFLNQQLVCEVYDEEVKHLTEAEKHRNILAFSRLFQYNSLVPDTLIPSPFKRIHNFISNVETTDIDLLKPFKWRTSAVKDRVNPNEENLLKMPTLHVKNFDAKISKESRAVTYNIEIQEPVNQNVKLGQILFYGYPQEHSGRVEGILTRMDLLTIPRFDIQNYTRIIGNRDFYSLENIRASIKSFFELMIQNYRKDCKFLDCSKTTCFLFIVDTQAFTRTLEGTFERVYKDNFTQNFRIIPLGLLSHHRKYRSTQTIISFKSIEEEFPMGEDVLVLCPRKQLCGCRAKVVGYSADLKKVEIVIERQHVGLNSKKLLQLATTNDIFFTMRFVAEIVGLRSDIIQTLLGSIVIQVPKSSQIPQIDIGLNFISRKESKMVPNLVRINFDNISQEQRNNPFRFLEFSVRALEILLEYKEKFPEIFEFIQRRHHHIVDQGKMEGRMNWGQEILNTDIYPKDYDAKTIMRVYVWLMEKEETHMPVSSIYSKQILQKRINKLQQAFIAARGQGRNPHTKPMGHFREMIDPNFLFSFKLSKIGTLHLSGKPKNHAIGDQIICICQQFFGHHGVVVGIDDTLYEVLFEEPSFGKNNLSGICENLWGYKLKYKEIFNFDTWASFLQERRKPETVGENLGWIESQETYYPKYRSKPLQDFNDFELLISKESNIEHFPPGMIQHILQVKKNLKQVVIDQEYIVVDNRKEDYKYKYDKKVSYISKEELEETTKGLKKLDQPINLVAPVFQSQIIENKAQKEVVVGDLGEEEDATDIIG